MDINFIRQIPNNLSSEFCKETIERFEQDPNKTPGELLAGHTPEIKDSLDLHISAFESWSDIDSIFYESLKDPLKEYIDDIFITKCKGVLKNPFDSGYQIQKTTPNNNGYTWHNDFAFADKYNGPLRIVTYIWYLNTVDEEGTTDFYDGTKIVPEEGKLVLFPATWTYVHKGNPPKVGSKYICTGWFYTNR